MTKKDFIFSPVPYPNNILFETRLSGRSFSCLVKIIRNEIPPNLPPYINKIKMILEIGFIRAGSPFDNPTVPIAEKHSKATSVAL
jgi:hypothetical protein